MKSFWIGITEKNRKQQVLKVYLKKPRKGNGAAMFNVLSW